jgi:hypothetical protein
VYLNLVPGITAHASDIWYKVSKLSEKDHDKLEKKYPSS